MKQENTEPAGSQPREPVEHAQRSQKPSVGIRLGFGRSLGWMSLDPREATSAVHSLPMESLRTVIENARCAEARRVALVRLGDEGLMEQAALSDPAPLVRRRMARELRNVSVLRKIADEDPDDSVRSEAEKRLGQLE